jgi:hypothetical protein
MTPSSTPPPPRHPATSLPHHHPLASPPHRFPNTAASLPHCCSSIKEGRWRSIGSVHPAADRGWSRDMAADPGRQHVPAVDPGHQCLPAADRTPPGLGDTTKGWLSESLALHAAAYLCHHRPHPPPPLALSTPVPSPIRRPLTPEFRHFRRCARSSGTHPPSLLLMLLLPLFPLPLLRARVEIVGRVVMVYCNTSLMCKHDTCRGNLCYYTCHVKAQHITVLIAIDL